jgi:hypothetical protein
LIKLLHVCFFLVELWERLQGGRSRSEVGLAGRSFLNLGEQQLCSNFDFHATLSMTPTAGLPFDLVKLHGGLKRVLFSLLDVPVFRATMNGPRILTLVP